MPVWNRANFVTKAIDSVIAQTFEDYELLIIDDGSQDNLSEIVQPYLCDKIKYYSIPHSGVGAARNYGLDKAKYPLIAYLDSDNCWHNDFLATMYNAIELANSKYAVAYCMFERFCKDVTTGQIYHDGTAGEPFSFKKLLIDNYIDLNTFVHTKDLLNYTGTFDPEINRLSDWDLMLRVTSIVEPIFVPKALVDYYFCVADNSISEQESHEVALKAINGKYSGFSGPFTFRFDTIPHVWNDLTESKHRNFWAHLNIKELNTSEYTPWAYPFVLQIEPTNACNLECPLCPVGRKMLERKTRHMTFEEFKSIVDDMSSYLLFLILWDWGEPFMNPDLPKMISYASQHDIRTVTSTNAHFLDNDAYLEQILTSGLSTLIIAVDSANQDRYQLYRKKGSLNKVITGLQKLVEMKKCLGSTTRINMRTVAMKQNEHELLKLRRLARRIGVDWFSIKTLNPSCGTEEMDDELVPTNPKYRRFEYDPHTNKRVRTQSICLRPWVMSNIFSNGDVVPCCYDYNSKMKIGNVFDEPFTQIWNSAAYSSIRKRIHNSRESLEKCRNCWINFKLSDSGWFPEYYDFTKSALSRLRDKIKKLKNKIKKRLRKTAIWPLLRFVKRTFLSGQRWIKKSKRILYLSNHFRISAGQFLPSQIRTLRLPLQEDNVSGWKPYGIFDGSTRNINGLSCHVSVLSSGKIPHEPHKHAEEEILIMLSGEAELITVESKQGDIEKRQSILPGSFVYYPAWHRHTIHNPGPKSATYLMFKWVSEQINSNETLDMSIVQLPQKQKPYSHPGKNGFAPVPLLDASTEYLRKLHCHITTLEPGSGYPPHADAYDVVIVVLSGRIKTLGKKIGANGVIFYATGKAHGMKNVGTSPAVYLVFEFHGCYSVLRG